MIIRNRCQFSGLNFRDVHIEEPGFSVAQFATAVANELMWALEGLEGKR
ncbi:MAG: hypothetical protein IKO17_04895 [Prevotella sp.]|nr:hypothetical protein [Prevotella sp.]